MTTVPAPTSTLSREEWPDVDFDLPDGISLHGGADSDKEDGEDWDVEMDLGKTGGAKVQAVVAGIVSRKSTSSQMFTIRPPLPSHSEDDEEDEEGLSTIKVNNLPKPLASRNDSLPPIGGDDDFEDAFALPSDLTQLSLRPLSLHHQSSKNSLEWGEKDQTSSSQSSSDAYSILGLAEISPSSSNSTTASHSQPETETDEDEEDLDGLVIPSGLFESASSAKHLAKLIEKKKKRVSIDESIKVIIPDPEDDFEIGLVIDDDADFSPSRLLHSAQQQQVKHRSAMGSRANSAPSRPLGARPPRLKNDRPKSPSNPPPSSARQFQKLKAPPSPPTRVSPPPRSQSYNALLSAHAGPSTSASAKSGSLRGQKSHTGLKPPTPTSQRKLVRKASLSALMETSHTQESGPESASKPNDTAPVARYESATAASRAKAHAGSTSRMRSLDYVVPPARPTTPSANPAALRLTMPTSSSRLKARPSITSVFPGSQNTGTERSSPVPTRPPSTTSLKSQAAAGPSTAASGPKVLRKPKRQRTYGDGTELDGFDDLPTDRDKESRFRVVPRGYGNRVPGGMYAPSKTEGKTATRRKTKDVTSSGSEALQSPEAAPRSLKHTGRIELPPKTSPDPATKRKKTVTSPTNQMRKPTLIRNLGGAAAPKVVGEMKWNPQILRWEGNDQALRDFDAVVSTSTRPALITHLTGSSVGSPVGSFASGARRVGNMIFDPARMCWISALSPEEDEPDVFAQLADDEEDGSSWEERGGTIRANQQQPTDSIATPSDVSRSATSSRMETPSPSRSSRHRRTPSESGSDRGSRASMVYDVDDTFLEQTRLAEERHRVEIKGWKIKSVDDRAHLYDIRALATRKY